MKNIGKKIIYSDKKEVIIINENNTHILVQFNCGIKICTNKIYYTKQLNNF